MNIGKYSPSIGKQYSIQIITSSAGIHALVSISTAKQPQLLEKLSCTAAQRHDSEDVGGPTNGKEMKLECRLSNSS